MTKLKLVLSNTYGHPNVGDEAIVTAMAQDLYQCLGDVEISFLSAWEELSQQNHPDLRVIKSKSFVGVGETTRAIRDADLLIVGGGGIIQDATSLGNLLFHLSRMVVAYVTNTPFMGYAVGVGPLTSKVARSLTKSVLNKAKMITVRDQLSADLLDEIGLSPNLVQVTADPVMNLRFLEGVDQHALVRKIHRLKETGHPLIAVSIRPVLDNYRIIPGSYPISLSSARLIQAVVEVIRQFIDTYDAHVMFCSMHPTQDDPIGRHLVEQINDPLRVTFVHADIPPQIMMSVLGQADMCLGMRLHSLILASRSSVPLVALSYAPKVEGFMRLLGQQNGVIDPVNWNFDAIWETTCNTWEYREKNS